MTFTPISASFFNVWTVLPYADLQDITIKNSRYANILFFNPDTVSLKNSYFENNSAKNTTSSSYGLFNVIIGQNLIVDNVTANNVYGSVFQIQDVQSQTYSNCNFYNMMSSQELTDDLQSIVRITKLNSPASKGLNPDKSQIILFDNFNANVRAKFFNEKNNLVKIELYES